MLACENAARNADVRALITDGLHPDEAIDILEKFLLAVAQEAVLRGLVYVVVGQEKHTGTADSARGSRKIRLADAVGSWLDSFSYVGAFSLFEGESGAHRTFSQAFWLSNGIYAIDPYL